MAVTADRVVVELEAKIDRYDANVRRAEQQFTRAMGSVDRSASRTSGLVTTAFRGIGTALAGVSAIALARQFISIADEASNLAAQLRLATSESGNYAQAQADVQRVAEATRSDLSATAQLYGNFQRNALTLGITQEQVARATETVGKTFKISGASAVESSQAIRQLVQGLQSGVLRGDEFNSVMEAAPRLTRLLADSLGVPVGALRAMAEEGELTSAALTRAFTDAKFTAGIDAEFKQLPVTFDDAMTLVYNSAVVTFGEFDRGGGFSQMLANFVSDGASGFDDLAGSAADLGIDIRSTFAGLYDVFEPIVSGAMQAFGVIDNEAKSLSDRIRPILGEIDAITRGINTYSGWGALTGAYGSDLQGTFDRGQQRSESERRNALAEQGIADLFRGFDAMGNRTGGAPRAASGAAASGGRSRAARAARSPLNPEAFTREEESLRARERAARISAATTAEERAELELADIAAERAFAAEQTRADERYTAAQQDRLIALQGINFALQGAAVLQERDAEIAERILRERQVTARNEERARDARAVNASIESDMLQDAMQLATSRQERARLEKRLLDIAQEQERIDLEALIASGRVADAEAARENLAQSQGLRRNAAARDSESPLEKYQRGLERSPEQISDLAEEWVVEELDLVQSTLRDAITSRIGIDDPILNGILDLFIEQVIMKPLSEAFANASSGEGGFIGQVVQGFSAVFGGARASGGHVSAGRMYKVNEAGIEGFQPAGSGKIIPLGRMRGAGGGGGVTVMQTVNVDASGSVNPDGYAEHIVRAVRRETVAIVGEGMKRVNKGVPGRVSQFQQDGT